MVAVVAQADVVLLPYDSKEQVTSGVLVEAVTAGKPVVSTGFPHAVEALGSGAGMLVDRQDPTAIADGLRRVLTEPDLAAWEGAVQQVIDNWRGSSEIAVKLVYTRGSEGDPDAEPFCYALGMEIDEKIKKARDEGIAVALLNRGYGPDIAERAPWLLLGAKTLSYAVNLFIYAMGRLRVDAPPIVPKGAADPANYADPLPQALVLTAIVISFAMTALLLVILLASRGLTGTDHVDGEEPPE